MHQPYAHAGSPLMRQRPFASFIRFNQLACSPRLARIQPNPSSRWHQLPNLNDQRQVNVDVLAVPNCTFPPRSFLVWCNAWCLGKNMPRTNCTYAKTSSAFTLYRSTKPMQLECGEGMVISKVEHASFGQPLGTCGAATSHTFLTNPSCHSSTTLDTVDSLCSGQKSCSIFLGDQVLGTPGQVSSTTLLHEQTLPYGVWWFACIPSSGLVHVCVGH